MFFFFQIKKCGVKIGISLSQHHNSAVNRSGATNELRNGLSSFYHTLLLEKLVQKFKNLNIQEQKAQAQLAFPTGFQ